MELRTIESLFEDQLKDLYSAEAQLLKALQKMAKRAESDSLRQAFERHLDQTREHVERLKGLGEELGLRLGGKKCAAMEGIIEEGSEVLDADGDALRLDTLSTHLPRDVGEIGDGGHDSKPLLGMERRGKEETEKGRGGKRQAHQNLCAP